MNAIDHAKKMITDCECALRDLLSQAALEGDYTSLEMIASWAKFMSTLPGIHEPCVVQAKQLSSNANLSQKVKPATVKPKYPFFKRNGNNLCKVGWSKKRKSEYKHNVSYEMLFDTINHFVKNMRLNKIYSTEELLPVTDRNEQDIPSYQVYICIAWLKEIGILSQNGRQGYSISNSEDVLVTAENAWIALQDSGYR